MVISSSVPAAGCALAGTGTAAIAARRGVLLELMITGTVGWFAGTV